jgi:hypothetical protein
MSLKTRETPNQGLWGNRLGSNDFRSTLFASLVCYPGSGMLNGLDFDWHEMIDFEGRSSRPSLALQASM